MEDVEIKMYDIDDKSKIGQKQIDKNDIIDVSNLIKDLINNDLKFAIFKNREKLLLVLFSPSIYHSTMLHKIKGFESYKNFQPIWAGYSNSYSVGFDSDTWNTLLWYYCPDPIESQKKYLEKISAILVNHWHSWNSWKAQRLNIKKYPKNRITMEEILSISTESKKLLSMPISIETIQDYLIQMSALVKRWKDIGLI